jgi:glycosyltransferase involved in cell wall biosynthesis
VLLQAQQFGCTFAQELERPQNIFSIAAILPNKYDAYEGDFVLRHAQAIALYHPITLVYYIDREDVDTTIVEKDVQGLLCIYRIYAPQKWLKPLRAAWYTKEINRLFCKLGGTETFDLVHAHIHWRAGLAARYLWRKHNIKYCLTEHLGYFNESIYGRMSVPRYILLKRWHTRQILRDAAVCMPVSHYLKQLLQRFEPQTNCVVVANVVDTDLFCHSPTDKPAVLTLLHMSSAAMPEKNIVRMLQGFALAKDAGTPFKVLLYVPQVPVVIDTIAQLDLQDTCTVKSFVAYEDVPAIMRHVHGVVVYSIAETFSCIAAESICCGTPVIGINVTGTAEIIDSSNGIKTDPYQPQDLAAAIATMAANYNSFDLKCISNAAMAKYSYKEIGQEISVIYKSIKARLS